MEKQALHIKGLKKSFSATDAGKEQTVVLNNIDLTVDANNVTSLIGGNGAGKTTLFNLISGLQKPDFGTIIYTNGEDEEELTHLPAYKIAQKGIGRLYQQSYVFNDLTVLENMLTAVISKKDRFGESIFASVFRRKKIKINETEFIIRAENILKKLYGTNSELWQKRNEEAGNLSYGQQRLLGLARLLMGEYNLLLLDEPTAGIQQHLAKKIGEIIKEEFIEKEHKTVFLIEHDREFVRKLGGNCYRFVQGKKTDEGTSEEVIHRIKNERKKENGNIQNQLPDIHVDNSVSVLSVSGLKASYKKSEHPDDFILKGIDFTLFRNEILSVVGLNGSGKSTLVKSIYNSTDLAINIGEIKINGFDKNLINLPAHKIARQNIAVALQGGEVFKNMTVAENLYFAGRKAGLSKKQINGRLEEIVQYFSFFNDKKIFKKNADTLSGGERHQLALAMVLLKLPQFLILDEPSAGLESDVAEEIYAAILQFVKKHNTSILLIEHNLQRCYRYSHRTAILKLGRFEKILDNCTFHHSEDYENEIESILYNKKDTNI